MVPSPRARKIARKASSRSERTNADPPSSVNALNGMRLRRGPVPARSRKRSQRSARAAASSSRVVVPGEEGVRQHRREAGRAGVLGGGLEHRLQRVGAVDGHERAPPPRHRRAQRDPQPHRRHLPVERADARRQPRRAHGDVAHVDGLRARLREHADGLDDPLDVGERLPHALEEDAVQPRAAGREIGAERPHLLDDLPRLQVAREPHAPRGAERARQRAPHLGADARGEPALALQRDAHRLDDGAVGQAEGILDEGIDRAGAPLHQLEGGHVAQWRAPRRGRAGGWWRARAPAGGPCGGRARRCGGHR